MEHDELLSLFGKKKQHIKAKPGNTFKRLSHLNLSWVKTNTSILKSEAIGYIKVEGFPFPFHFEIHFIDFWRQWKGER